MAALIRTHGPARWRLRRPYAALCGSIISQQLSTKVARTILKRFRARFPTQDSLAKARLPALRAIGLSAQKSGYLRGIARFAKTGGLRGLDRFDDEPLIEQLTALKGVGVWTAHMFLMFSLGRPDVWPIGDYGIQKGAQQEYSVDGVAELSALGDRFAPYRSAAAIYLWRAID